MPVRDVAAIKIDEKKGWRRKEREKGVAIVVKSRSES